MTYSMRTASHSFFDRMNKAFWAIWVLFPVTVAGALYFQSKAKLEDFTPDQIKCLGDKLSFGQGSTATAVASLLLLLYEIGFYVLMFALLHRMIRNFRNGTIFVDQTLASVQRLGWLVAGFPLVGYFLAVAANFLLRQAGAPVLAGADTYIDLGPVAMGLFLVALKQVLQQAIHMKSENDLTI